MAAAGPGGGPVGRLRAEARARGVTGRAGALLGKDLDDAADRVRAPHARTRPAHDLDALNERHGDQRKRGRADRGRADAHAVNNQQQMVRLRAAHPDAADLAMAAAIVHIDAGYAAQQGLQALRLQAFNIGPSQDGRGQRQPVQRGGRARARDDNFIGGRCGPNRAKRKQTENGDDELHVH